MNERSRVRKAVSSGGPWWRRSPEADVDPPDVVYQWRCCCLDSTRWPFTAANGWISSGTKHSTKASCSSSLAQIALGLGRVHKKCLERRSREDTADVANFKSSADDDHNPQPAILTLFSLTHSGKTRTWCAIAGEGSPGDRCYALCCASSSLCFRQAMRTQDGRDIVLAQNSRCMVPCGPTPNRRLRINFIRVLFLWLNADRDDKHSETNSLRGRWHLFHQEARTDATEPYGPLIKSLQLAHSIAFVTSTQAYISRLPHSVLGARFHPHLLPAHIRTHQHSTRLLEHQSSCTINDGRPADRRH